MTKKKGIKYSITNCVLGKINSPRTLSNTEKGCPEVWGSLEMFKTHLDNVSSNLI